MGIWWNKLSWSAKFLTAWFALGVLSLAALFVASRVFHADFPMSGPAKPPFSFKECRWEVQDELFNGVDSSDLSDDARSTIASICARRQVDYQRY